MKIQSKPVKICEKPDGCKEEIAEAFVKFMSEVAETMNISNRKLHYPLTITIHHGYARNQGLFYWAADVMETKNENTV